MTSSTFTLILLSIFTSKYSLLVKYKGQWGTSAFTRVHFHLSISSFTYVYCLSTSSTTEYTDTQTHDKTSFVMLMMDGVHVYVAVPIVEMCHRCAFVFYLFLVLRGSTAFWMFPATPSSGCTLLSSTPSPFSLNPSLWRIFCESDSFLG